MVHYLRARFASLLPWAQGAIRVNTAMGDITLSDEPIKTATYQ